MLGLIHHQGKLTQRNFPQILIILISFVLHGIYRARVTQCRLYSGESWWVFLEIQYIGNS